MRKFRRTVRPYNGHITELAAAAAQLLRPRWHVISSRARQAAAHSAPSFKKLQHLVRRSAVQFVRGLSGLSVGLWGLKPKSKLDVVMVTELVEFA
jgi:hypothetical protein